MPWVEYSSLISISFPSLSLALEMSNIAKTDTITIQTYSEYHSAANTQKPIKVQP